MKKSVLIPLVVAIAAAVIYMLILSSNQSKFQESSKLEWAVVAKRDLPERKVLDSNDLFRVQIPVKFLQKDFLPASKDSDISRLQNNFVTRIAIPRGNQITKAALTTLSPDAGLSSRVTPGWRGFVLTDVPSAVANLLKPDDLIDVLLTFEAVMKSTGNKERITATILQKVRVLGVGSDLGQGVDASQAKNRDVNASTFNDSTAISLALAPKDAQYLALAKEEGTITLVIRRRDDLNAGPVQVASIAELFR
ncbi:MAG: Flp pilus assembly protein CpaB [Elusimicrobium sp.]|jgi:pilus assembly protein CpaB|nr:Flp pilus assembly protein CpaB [Elusimicrobium sp.]